MPKKIFVLLMIALNFGFQAEASTILSLEFHKQERELSCEAAALAMVLNYHGVKTSETDVIGKMPMDSTARQGDVWGDPDIGFVGQIDGVMGETGYGIHWNPVARMTEEWKKIAIVLEKGEVADLVANLDQKRPILIWGVDGPGRKLSWKTPRGRKITALSNEHTFVVYGYEGDRNAPTSFLVMDPRKGPQVSPKKEFLKNWDSFGRKGIVVYH